MGTDVSTCTPQGTQVYWDGAVTLLVFPVKTGEPYWIVLGTLHSQITCQAVLGTGVSDGWRFQYLFRWESRLAGSRAHAQREASDR